MFKKKEKKAPVSADPKSWTEAEVGNWIEQIGLGKYKKNFADQSIQGSELLDLTDSELASLKLNPSERAKCLLAIQQLRRRYNEGGDIGKEDDDSSTSASSATSSSSTTRDLIVKCFLSGSDDIRRITSRPDITLHDLKKRIRRLYKHKMTLRYRDADGDMINIRKDEDWTACLQRFGTGEVKLELKQYEKSLLHRNEAHVLEAMVDGVVMIEGNGRIYFINRAAERITGYKKEEIVGSNVNVLMTDVDAVKHDGYLQRYLATHEAHIIGIGRQVTLKRKDGTTLAIELSVSHTKTKKRDVFTGILHPVSTGTTAAASSTSTSSSPFAHVYTVLANLPHGSIVISEEGIVQYANSKALEMLGYKTEQLIGQNIKIICPEPHAAMHDMYIKTYVTTGKAKIIGRPRDLIAQTKDGSMIPVKLAVSEQWVGTVRIFTATIFVRDEETVNGSTARASEKSVLQQERESVSHLAIAAVVIDQRGLIQAFNPAAEKLWGFSFTEVAGRNVKVLMGFADAERHDDHIKRYLTTGKTKVIGTGRQVVGQRKNGDMFPVHLAVSERIDGEKKIWTAIAQPV